MKRKALLSMIIAMGICAAFTGCGKTDDEVSNGTEQPSYNEAMGIIDSEVTGAVVTPHDVIAPEALASETEAVEEVVIEPVQEILDAEFADNKVQLGTKVFTFPLTLQTLLDGGAVILDDTNPITDVIYMAGDDFVTFSIDNKEYDLNFENKSGNKKQVKDCYAYNISGYNFILAKGIRCGSSVDELKAAWGEPTKDDLDVLNYEGRYVYTNSYGNECTAQKCGYWFHIDLEKQTITSISCSFYADPVDSSEESESTALESNEESIETSTTEE